MITRKDLYDHVMAHECKIEKLPEINNRGNAVLIVNPKTNRKAFLNTPIDETSMSNEIVQRLCARLGIPPL